MSHLFSALSQWTHPLCHSSFASLIKTIKNKVTMATQWKIDPVHSEILFKVKHLMITTVTGSFKQYDLNVETETDDFTTAKKIEFTADINSINTNNEQRDTHLKSADFFSAEKHPQLRFVGTKYEAKGDDAKLHGDLTIRGVTKPITLNVEFAGIVVDPYGQTKAGFTGDGKVSRKEYGLTWNAVTEAGSVVVSDEIKIHAEVQLVKRA
ncbi:MAG TPA: YceI family protein [Segetibacter sp.]|jgi:polyisoprenoid-binding protein YceI|nr:YceI family protein [Segetibacter sp.]